MTEFETDTDPLLRPLGAQQNELLTIVGEAVSATGTWPVYQRVGIAQDGS